MPDSNDSPGTPGSDDNRTLPSSSDLLFKGDISLIRQSRRDHQQIDSWQYGFPGLPERLNIYRTELDIQRELASALDLLRQEMAGHRTAVARLEELECRLQQRLAVELEQRVRERTGELSRINAELARTAHLKDEFLASISHELRTPLTGILSLTEALREQVYGPLPDKPLQMLKMIEDSGRYLLALVNDLLDLAKIEAGQMELELAPCVLGEIGQASLQLINGVAGKKHQRLSLTVAPPDLAMQADGRRLKQMLANLLGNASKFTPEGGRIGLEITGDPDAGVVRLAVWDNGIGIAAEDMPRLFHPFVQLDCRLKQDSAGTGLGLPLVKRMAELHGGDVTVESNPGQGSRFTIILPWKPPVASESIQIRHEAIVTEPVVAGQALILLADDSKSNRMAYIEYLQAKGYEVVEAEDGVEAVEKARTLRPAVILMDIQMPELSGLEAIQQLRADPDPAVARTPIIALTALAMPGDRERCLAAGADDYLSKPLTLKDLLAAIAVRLAA